MGDAVREASEDVGGEEDCSCLEILVCDCPYLHNTKAGQQLQRA
jgi:hypothetical protein